MGGTGVVGVLRNGDGPTVWLRADMDPLPVREETGWPYDSKETAAEGWLGPRRRTRRIPEARRRRGRTRACR
ncbi:MAG TPA: hypothetical protein VFD59_10460 [Nocardioidaceae bacterium]|nr:hypothetical protein [Nocardioidaceae bacterium]